MMHYTLFGESHGPAVGVLLTDVPPGLPVDEAFIREQLLRRMGQGGLTTARQEKEEVHFLSGVYQGRTTGDPLAVSAVVVTVLAGGALLLLKKRK